MMEWRDGRSQVHLEAPQVTQLCMKRWKLALVNS